MLWPKQNHVLIFILSVFGLFVFLNVFSVGLLLPHLLKMLTGRESVFTLSGAYAVNTTFLAIAAGVAYLCLNPLVKAVYVLRCFYGESRRSGEDLHSELRSFRVRAGTAALIVLMLLALPCAAGETGEVTPTAPVEIEKLDRAIDRVLAQPEYSWRMPREKAEPGEIGVVGGFFRAAFETMYGWLEGAVRWMGGVGYAVRDFIKRLVQKLFPGKREWDPSLPEFRMGWIHWLVFICGAALVVGLVLLILRVFRNRRRRTVVEALSMPLPPDVSDESTSPNELPSDEWLALAGELMEKGELRLALRAVYLGTLAYLSQAELVAIARFKSCRDYERELARRAHSRPEMQAVFSKNLAVFEGAWYGEHPVSIPVLDDFKANHERIRVDAGE